jgi:RimJ/RimL family protein N-acetyltransferase
MGQLIHSRARQRSPKHNNHINSDWQLRCAPLPAGYAGVGHGDEELKIRQVQDQDRDWIRTLLRERWQSPEVVTRGILHQADRLLGFLAIESDQPVGLVTYNLKNEDCEIVSLDSLESGKGIGTSLINAVVALASSKGCHRVWLITTNDNTAAICFYQKIGFVLVTIHRDAIRESRKLKPGIPERGNDGIPIRDEIELEIRTQWKPNKGMQADARTSRL